MAFYTKSECPDVEKAPKAEYPDPVEWCLVVLGCGCDNVLLLLLLLLLIIIINMITLNHGCDWG